MSCISLPDSGCVSATPSDVCIEIIKDADTTLEVTLLNDKEEMVDITLDTVRLTVWDYSGGAIKLQKTNAPGGHEKPTDGKTLFSILNTDITDVLTDRETVWMYEARRIDSGALEYVHIAGDFVVRVI